MFSVFPVPNAVWVRNKEALFGYEIKTVIWVRNKERYLKDCYLDKK